MMVVWLMVKFLPQKSKNDKVKSFDEFETSKLEDIFIEIIY